PPHRIGDRDRKRGHRPSTSYNPTVEETPTLEVRIVQGLGEGSDHLAADVNTLELPAPLDRSLGRDSHLQSRAYALGIVGIVSIPIVKADDVTQRPPELVFQGANREKPIIGGAVVAAAGRSAV